MAMSGAKVDLASSQIKLDRKIRHIDVILVGKTGHGKSATGNTILGRSVFASSNNVQSVTKNICYDVGRYINYVFKVMDTPGVADTAGIADPVKASKIIISQMSDAVVLNTEGYHAFLLVYRFGGRFTKEEFDSVRMFKHIFGEKFMKNYCILIITGGDHFFSEIKSKGKSFKTWRHEQQGEFKDLIHECKDRVVLFDNVTHDKNVRKKQMGKLINYVHSLKTDGKRYTDKYFQQAQQSRNRFLSETSTKIINSELEKMYFVLPGLESVVRDNLDKRSDMLNVILQRIESIAEQFPNISHTSPIESDFTKFLSEVKDFTFTYRGKIDDIITTFAENDKKLHIESKRLADIFYSYAKGKDELETLKKDSKRNGGKSEKSNVDLRKSRLDVFTEKTELSDVEFIKMTMNRQSEDDKCDTFIDQERDTQSLKEKMIKEFERDAALKIIITTNVQLHKLLGHIDTEFLNGLVKFQDTYNILREKSQNILKQKCKCPIM